MLSDKNFNILLSVVTELQRGFAVFLGATSKGEFFDHLVALYCDCFICRGDITIDHNYIDTASLNWQLT